MEIPGFNQSFEELVALLDSPKQAGLAKTQAVIALKDLGDKRAIEPLLKLLVEPAVPVAMKAIIEFLAKNGDDRTVAFLWQVICNPEHILYTRSSAGIPLATISLQSQALLFEGLQHPYIGVRQAVMHGLSKLGTDAAVEALTKVLKTETNQSIRRSAIHALIETANPKNLAPLLEILENKTDPMRSVVVVNLGYTNNFEVIAPLAKILLEDENPDIREGAAVSLGVLKHPQAAAPLLKVLLEDDDSSIRSSCADGLRNHTTEPIARELIFALHDSSAEIRAKVARLLGDTNDSQAIRPLLEVAKNEAEKNEVRGNAIISLGKLKRQTDNDWLVDLLSSKKTILRAAAADALGDLCEVVAFEPLLKALNAGFRDVREAAVVALLQLNQPDTAKVFLQRLEVEEEWDTRSCLVKALGKLGDKSALEPLLKLLNQRGAIKLSVLISALGNLGDNRACSALTDFLDNPDISIRVAAIFALAKLGDANGIDLVIYLLRDYSYYTRYEAIQALAELGEKALPALSTLEWLSQNDHNEIEMVNETVTIAQAATKAMQKIISSVGGN